MSTIRRIGESRGHLPEPVVDIVPAVGLAVAITIAIRTSPPRAVRPMPSPTAWGWSLPRSPLFRRRWPLVVLLASAATYQIYNLVDYPGLFPAPRLPWPEWRSTYATR
jgi:hypothetical protein